jgi:S1-C subfamily serine protease
VLPVPAITLGDGDGVRKGQFVLSIANPFAAGYQDGSPSASWGIISNIRRRAPGRPEPTEQDRAATTLHHYGTLLQIDARLNLGCSGGALIDLKGEMIGLTTSLAAISGTETAGGFAVPMTARMKRIVNLLKEGKEVEYGFLGITFNRTNLRAGVQVGEVLYGSPAFRAGLRPMERILRVEGKPVHDNDDLFLEVGTLLAGSEAHLQTVSPLRQQPVVKVVKLEKYYVPGPIVATNRPPPVRGMRVDYTSVLIQKANLRMEIPQGVWVSEVVANSPADKAQLQNAVILQVNDQEVQTPADFYRLSNKVTGPLELTLMERDENGSNRRVRLD